MEALKLKNKRVTPNEEKIKLEVFNHFSKKFCRKNKDDFNISDFQELFKEAGELEIENKIYRAIPKEIMIHEVLKAASKIK